MESKLFSQFDPKDVKEDRFGEDISLLLSLSEKQLALISDNLESLLKTRTTAEAKPIIESLESKTGLARTTIERVITQLRFFISALYDEETKKDEPSLWAADLIELDLLPKESGPLFLKVIQFLKENFESLASLHRERRTESGVLPVFRGVDTTVELRAVLKNEYKLGTDVELFEPELQSMCSVVSVAISVDSGLNKNFTFQATPDELNYLISELRAAQKCASIMEKLNK